MSTFQSWEFDPNTIFTLSYNFEGMKILLQTLVSNQKNIIQRLSTLEQNNSSSSPSNHNNNHNHQTSPETNTENKPILPTGKDGVQDKPVAQWDIIPKKRIVKFDENNGSNNSNNNSHLKNQTNELDSSGVNNDYDQKIKALERKISQINSFLPSFSDQKQNNLTEMFDDYKRIVANLNDKTQSLENEIHETNSGWDEIRVKVQDFNVYELFKDANTEGGSVDASKILIQNLENKVFKKFNLVEEKIKLIESDIFKNKQTMDKIKNSSDLQTRHLNQLKEEVEGNAKKIDELANDTDDKLSQLQTGINSVNDHYNAEVSKWYNEIQLLHEENKESNKEEAGDERESNKTDSNLQASSMIGEKEFRKFKELVLKKIYDVDKRFIVFTSEVNIESIKTELLSWREKVNVTASDQDMYDANDKISTLSNLWNRMKENEYNINDDLKKLRLEINGINKVNESLQTQLTILKNGGNGMNWENMKSKLDWEKLENYVSHAQLQDFLRGFNKDFEKCKKDIIELRQYVVDLNSNVKEKASEEEWKNWEEYIISLIEELKESFNKKFPTKIEANRNMKVFEAQIKQMIEITLKHEDKGDNWWIAKRPLQGYSCASCEAYWGEWKAKNEYLTWNKVPAHDQFEKTYRIGDGFSRILNLVNLDKDKKEEHAPYTDPNAFDKEDKKKAQMKTTQNDINNPNWSTGNIQVKDKKQKNWPPIKTEENHKYLNQDEPKVMKIYKVKKNNNNN